MAGRVVGWAFDQCDKVKAPSTMLLLVKLADNANEEGEAYPSLARIIRETKMGRTTVCRHIKILESLGLVKVRREHVGDVSLPNRYFLQVPWTKTVRDDQNARNGWGSSGADRVRGSGAAPNPSEEEPSKEPLLVPDASHLELAEFMKPLQAQALPKQKPPTKQQIISWANEVRLMVEQDKRTLAEITLVMRWAYNDPFWKSRSEERR